MSTEKGSILKIIVGFILIVLTLAAIKMYMLPLIDELSLRLILTLPMLDVLKIAESILILILLAGFVLQEVVHALSGILQEHENSSASHPPWRYLWYLLAGVFGSAGLYMTVLKISQEVPF